MSGNDNSPPPTPMSARRASFAPGSTLSELFGRSPPPTNGQSAFPGSIAAAAQASQRRRMSVATVGLGASPTQNSPFGNRQNSFSSNGSAQDGESAIDDSGDAMSPPTGSSPFARRLSFGARAMSGITGSVSNTGTTPPSSSKARGFPPPSVEESHEEDPPFSPKLSNTFNRRAESWADQMRTRAQRSSSINSPTLPSGRWGKSASISVAPAAAPVQPAPVVKQQAAPDHFQERILKGDFYMD